MYDTALGTLGYASWFAHCDTALASDLVLTVLGIMYKISVENRSVFNLLPHA